MHKRFDMLGVITAAMIRLEGRADANETAMFARQLEHVFTQVYEVKKTASVWRQFAPINREVSNADEAHTFREIESFGEAKFVDGYAAKDFPSIEIQGKEFSGVVKSIGDSYAYTIQDMRRAAQTGLDLSARKAMIARDVIERKLDDVAFNGDATYGFTGLKALSNIIAVTPVVGDWENATTDGTEMLADVTKMAEAIFEQTKGECEGSVLLAPTKAYKKLRYTYLPGSGGSPRTTLEEFILGGVKGLSRIIHAPRLDTAGASSKGRLMLLDNRPEVLEAVLPQDFEQFAPQQDGLRFLVPCHARWGGWKLHQPKGVAYMDGTEA
jgi:hypothetical protein